MKKLYRKGTVHPSPPPPPPPSSGHLSFLPAAILTLAAALSAEDKEVLAYLLSCSSSSCSTTPFDNFDPTKSSNKKHPNKNNVNNTSSSSSNNSHAICFTCYCFNCYTSYWARWDCSPNRQLIHEIIDAFEDGLLVQKKKKQGVNKRDKKKNIIKNNTNIHNDMNSNDNKDNKGLVRVGSVEEVSGQAQLGDDIGEKQGSVRKIVGFIGEKIWGSVWG